MIRGLFARIHLGLSVFVVLVLPPNLEAQGDVEAFGRYMSVDPPPGYYELLRDNPRAFQFSENNGWTVRGHAVAASRNRQRQSAARASGAPSPASSTGGVLSGELTLAVFLILFSDTDSTTVATTLPREDFDANMFGSDPAPPYSVNTFYREMSNNTLTVSGTVFDWTRVSEADSIYEAGCNGLCSAANVPFTNMIAELVAARDGAVDFGQFDNDGPDGLPNSADDDGYVDAIVLFHPELDGACGGNDNLWAHRWSYRGRRGADLLTDDDALGGGKIKVRDYIVQGGQGGPGGCTAGQPQAIGVVSHETGHLFGLPDLYDTSNEGEGIGHWGLMGSGNWHFPSSPAHMMAWSKAQLGWITEVVMQTDTVLKIGPVMTSDTAFILPIDNRDEYFILENRQAIGSDAFVWSPGLLIWHADSVAIRQRTVFNSVNASRPNALALEQADARTDLQDGANRGDATDPFPGAGNKTAFGPGTIPSSATNDGANSFVAVDSITQEPSGAITARIRFERPTVIETGRAFAVFRLDGAPFTEFEQRLTPGSEHTLDMDDVQLVDGGRRRYTWVSWSNGEQRSHVFVASQGGDSIVATTSAEFLVRVGQEGIGGSVTADPQLDFGGGELLVEGTEVTLTASVDSAGHVFEGWSGDTTTANPVVVLAMERPYEVTATFGAPLVVPSAAVPQAIMGASYRHELGASGGIGTFTWELVQGTLPRNLSLRFDGVLTGIPEVVGQTTFTARIRSGSQTVEQQFTLGVVPPALVVADVVRQLVGLGSVLSADEVRYLDLVGNRTGQFDLGDFLAWVETTGGVVSAAEMGEVLRQARPAEPATRGSGR